MIDEDINKIEEKVEKQSFAMELLKFSKDQNKQLERANKRLVTILIIIVSMWFLTIGGFLYYIFTVDYITTEETAEVENENGTANACIGDNCNNGEINYGESESYEED